MSLTFLLGPADVPPAIEGKTEVEAGRLVRLRATHVPEGAVTAWAISPRVTVDRATTPRGTCEFSAAPGTYTVVLIVALDDAEWTTIEVETVVTVTGCGPVPPAPPPVVPPVVPPSQPFGDLIRRVQFGSAGCTGSAIHPKLPDGRWDILTAAHCVPAVGGLGKIQGVSGKWIGVEVVALDRTADIAWLRTIAATDDLGALSLSPTDVAVGREVWHAGYGIGTPGQVRRGKCVAGQGNDGKQEYSLSVNSGDSGGPIVEQQSGYVVGTVCCTTERGVVARVWAGSATRIAALRPVRPLRTGTEWTPLTMPLVAAGRRDDTGDPPVKPMPMPIRE